MNKLTILHLSDLHYEKKKQNDTKIVLKALFSDLEKFMNEGMKINLVIFSGDLIHIGDNGFSSTINEYEEVSINFVQPLLQHLNLSCDEFIICPGNHDIQRMRIDEDYEAGLKIKLNSRTSVNEYIDKQINNNHPLAFSRLENFEQFFKSINNKNIYLHNPLYSIYKYEFDGIHIGIASINSAWRAFGGEGDYGQLILGDRVINSCIDHLEECSIKIGVVHHPFNYLLEFERDELNRLVSNSFNFWMTGHIHENDIKLVQVLNDDQLVSLSGGALYVNRNYYNGYALLEYDLLENTGQVYLREYSDRGRCFGSASFAKDNNALFNFKLSTKKPAIDKRLSLIMSIKEKAYPNINNCLLPSISLNKLGSKTIEDLFVPPPLYNEAESVLKTTKDVQSWVPVSIEEILDTGQNYFIAGRKESGKTTLLQYLFLKSSGVNNKTILRYPVLIDFKNLPTGKNRLEKAISNFFIENNISINLREVMRLDEWILFIDNFFVDDQKSLEAFKNFLSEHPSWQYIITIEENILKELRENKPESFGINFQNCYIHSFARKEVRAFVEKWFSNPHEKIDYGEVADLVLRRIAEASLPITPLMVTMMLIAIENCGENYNPINKASLMEIIIEILLEKSSAVEYFRGNIDFRNMEDFLSNFSKHLVENNHRSLSEDEYNVFSSTYFLKRGLIVPGGFQKLNTYLTSRGIISINNGQASFRFDGFYQYFIGKQMANDPSFYSKILHEDDYLRFSSPIEYLTGLQRNNEQIVELIHDRVIENIGELEKKYNLCVSLDSYNEFFTHTDVQPLFTSEEIEDIERDDESKIDKDGEGRKGLVENIEQLKFSEEDKDRMFMDFNRVPEITGSVGNDANKIDVEAKVISSLILYANAIRNCELSSKDFKQVHLHECLETSLKFTYIFIQFLIENNISNLRAENIQKYLLELNPKLKTSIDRYPEETLRLLAKAMIREIIFMIMNAITNMEVGSPKLQVVIEEELNDPGNHLLLRLAYLLLSIDLRLPGYIENIEKSIKLYKDNPYYINILLQKMRGHYIFSYFSDSDNRKLVNAIADMTMLVYKQPKYTKNIIINSIVKKKKDQKRQ